MLDFPRWKVWLTAITCIVGVLLAVPSLLPERYTSNLPSFANQRINLGLDLAGGSQLLLEAQTADVVLPADRERLELVRDWDDGEDYIEARDTGGAAMIAYDAGAAYAVLSGPVEPGLYETGGEVVAEEPGLRLHGFQFTPRPPAS